MHVRANVPMYIIIIEENTIREKITILCTINTIMPNGWSVGTYIIDKNNILARENTLSTLK